MFTQITIIKIDDDNFKITLFDQNGVLYTEIIPDISDVVAMAKPTLERMKPDPRSAYAQPK